MSRDSACLRPPCEPRKCTVLYRAGEALFASAQQVAARLTKFGSEKKTTGQLPSVLDSPQKSPGGEPLPNIEGAQSTVTCKPSEGMMFRQRHDDFDSGKGQPLDKSPPS